MPRQRGKRKALAGVLAARRKDNLHAARVVVDEHIQARVALDVEGDGHLRGSLVKVVSNCQLLGRAGAAVAYRGTGISSGCDMVWVMVRGEDVDAS